MQHDLHLRLHLHLLCPTNTYKRGRFIQEYRPTTSRCLYGCLCLLRRIPTSSLPLLDTRPRR
ncbi:hypothetical protein A1O3_05733 [Capronia epimyces CBS 606.96]|uniref:Uncharacterized protein n=1 Tax=Capronia epimyces CBS 606.96 TaxID=1182542 RepID=W9XXU6_9EURO|nr:uncharacterized protein A1O3_05733 [Capronia epimyces CBS 606.96]EXJ85058.1 hypothetical protein A1O3_05733 [Capronia epimyces CBS 606.96]